MTVTLSLNPETEARLREHVIAEGKDLPTFIREAVEEKLYLLGRSPAGPRLPEERVRLWRDWVASHPPRPEIVLDDSRESIYDNRGE